MRRFEFFDTGNLGDGEVILRLLEKRPPDADKELAPTYVFDICSARTGERMGTIDLRVGHSEKLYFAGNIGFCVEKPFRGHRYAAKACRLLFELARRHGMSYLIITCNPENLPSRRTCEILGMRLIEIARLPAYNDMYKEGEREKCVFEMVL